MDACITLISRRAASTEADEWMDRVERNWKELGDAPSHIQQDLDVVLAAVQQHADAIQPVMRHIFFDRERVRTIIQTNADVFEHVALGRGISEESLLDDMCERRGSNRQEKYRHRPTSFD